MHFLNRISGLLLVLLTVLSTSVLAQQSTSGSYTPIIATSSGTWDDQCNGPSTTIAITLPAGENVAVTSISYDYDFVSVSPNAPNTQKSYLHLANTGVDDNINGNVSGIVGETFSYAGTSSFANGTYPGGTTLVFEIRAWRTFGANPGCNDLDQYIDGYNLTVNHTAPFDVPKVGINTHNPKAALDVQGKIKLSDDNSSVEEGNLRYNESNADFEGYTNSGWRSLTTSRVGELKGYTGSMSNAVTYNLDQNITITDSIAIIYDSGGPSGDYQNNEDYQVDFDLSAFSDAVGINFAVEEFDLASFPDNLQINDARLNASFNTQVSNIQCMACGVIRFVSSPSGVSSGFKIVATVIFDDTYTPTDILSYADFSNNWQYIPEKDALSAGSKNFGVDSVGLRALQYGTNAFASGEDAISFGEQSKASGDHAISFGKFAEAEGDYSISLGRLSNASADNAVSIGTNADARGPFSVSIGQGTDAAGYASTSLGYFTNAFGHYSTAMGNSSTSLGDYSTSSGKSCQASGDYTVSLGKDNTAFGDYATSLGLQASADGIASFSAGFNTEADGISAVSIGSNSSATGTVAVAIGNITSADGDYSTALGHNTISVGDYSIAMGRFNVGFSNTILELGYGTSAANRRNAMTIRDNGFIGLSEVAQPMSQLHLGNDSSDPWQRHIRLDYDGANGVFGNILYDSDGMIFRNQGNGTDYTFYNNANQVTATITDIGNLCLTGNVTCASDRTLKRDIVRLNGSLNKIIAIRGYNYYWKATPESDDLQTGVIAQELREIFPELVLEDDDGLLSVNYIGLTPHLVEAVKELKVENDGLSQQLETLQADYEDLKAVVDELSRNLKQSQDR
jgi:hypothetical protein